MSPAELRVKFDSLVIPVLGEERAKKIADMVASIEACTDINQLMEHLG
jgi:hypothetical protein